MKSVRFIVTSFAVLCMVCPASGAFNQDDAHLFVRPDQLTDEIVGVVKLIDLGIASSLALSTM